MLEVVGAHRVRMQARHPAAPYRRSVPVKTISNPGCCIFEHQRCQMKFAGRYVSSHAVPIAHMAFGSGRTAWIIQGGPPMIGVPLISGTTNQPTSVGMTKPNANASSQ